MHETHGGLPLPTVISNGKNGWLVRKKTGSPCAERNLGETLRLKRKSMNKNRKNYASCLLFNWQVELGFLFPYQGRNEIEKIAS